MFKFIHFYNVFLTLAIQINKCDPATSGKKYGVSSYISQRSEKSFFAIKYSSAYLEHTEEK